MRDPFFFVSMLYNLGEEPALGVKLEDPNLPARNDPIGIPGMRCNVNAAQTHAYGITNDSVSCRVGDTQSTGHFNLSMVQGEKRFWGVKLSMQLIMDMYA